MKLENDWRNKTLENLEKKKVGEPGYDSHLVKRCTELHKIPVGDFTVEDLRIMIGQGFGLIWLIPLALEKLEQDILAKGDFYPGDLLKNVARINGSFWAANPGLYSEIKQLITQNQPLLNAENISLPEF